LILIDANNLSYISFHSVGGLSYEDMQTGVIFGFLRSVLTIADKLDDNHIVFCWDSKKSFRKIMYPEYKMNRKPSSDEDKERRQIINKQMNILRTEVLPELGFKNNLIATGYEADDLIAECSRKSPCVIVSTDSDLFQLINSDVTIYNPITKKIWTYDGFIDKYTITPTAWIIVKSMMGDNTDNIIGINGVGEKTAIKYITGNLKEGKIKDSIEANREVTKTNYDLIALPLRYKNRKLFVRVIKNKYSRSSFIDVFDRFHFISFLDEERFIKWEKTFNL
jgi:DNA polymerase-1